MTLVVTHLRPRPADESDCLTCRPSPATIFSHSANTDQKSHLPHPVDRCCLRLRWFSELTSSGSGCLQSHNPTVPSDSLCIYRVHHTPLLLFINSRKKTHLQKKVMASDGTRNKRLGLGGPIHAGGLAWPRLTAAGSMCYFTSWQHLRFTGRWIPR